MAVDLNDLVRARRLPADISLEGTPMNDGAGVVRIGPWAHLPAAPHPALAEAEGGLSRPPFPVEALPPAVAEFVAAVATFTQTPADLAGVLALGVLSAAVAGKARVRVKGHYAEPLNLFLIAAMPPGERKSAVFRAMFSPLARYEERLRKETQARRAVTRAERKALEDEAASLRKRLPRAKGGERSELEREVAENARKLDELPSCEDPVLYVQDVTSERLVKVLEEQGGRVAIADAEGTFFSNILGRYGEEVNLDNVLKGHAGDTIRVERIGRPSVHVDRPAITLVLAVQPDVIRAAAEKPGVRDRGLLGRLLMSLPASLVGYRDVDAPDVPQHLWARYGEAVRKLLDLVVPTEAWFVALDDGARAAFLDLAREVEAMLGPGRELAGMRDWGGKLTGAVARMAGVLHFAEAACLGDEALRRAWVEPVSEVTMLCAVELGGYFLEHARSVYGELLAAPAERRERDRHASALATLAWLYPGGREFTSHEPLEALWPNTKAPPPPGGVYAREALAAFAGKKNVERPGKDDLGYALRGAAGKAAGGLLLERRGVAHAGGRKWAVVPASSPSSPSSPRTPKGPADHPRMTSHPPGASSADAGAISGFQTGVGEHGADGEDAPRVRSLAPVRERGDAS